MSEFTRQSSPIPSGVWPPFPASMMQASDSELTDITLDVVEGTLPDLHGHVFIIAPVGSVNSGGLPNPDGCHVWNGNGMVYRLDFDQPGTAKLMTRLVKSPCYYADYASRPGGRFAQFQFRDYGMARFSLALGMRNELNTALVPITFSEAEGTRLLVTFDGGRPYEIDPVTLEVITPVGSNQEWRPGMPLKVPFLPVLSTAHPAFDPQTQELFTVNYGRSLANFLETIPLLYTLEALPQELEQLLEEMAQFLHQQDLWQMLLSPVLSFNQTLLDRLQRALACLLGIDDFVYLQRWRGQDLERWRLVLPDGRPVRIEQTMHQVGVCRDYVIVMDTSLKFGLEQILTNPVPRSKETERLLRSLLTRPQQPNTPIYLIRRDQLLAGQCPAQHQPEVTVTAYPLTIPLEAAHFLVDYENPQDQITLHMAHECATDVSEWVRRYDTSAYDPKQGLSPALEGMISVGAMDVGRLGRYVVDASQLEAHGASLVTSQIVHDTRRTWGLGLYACRETQASGQSAPQLKNIYWQSLGFWPELLSDFIFKLYRHYPHRIIPVDQVLHPPEYGRGRPSSLFRLDTQTMAIADAYDFPLLSADGTAWDAHVVNSPQFIPKREDALTAPQSDIDASMRGYILCTVISQHRKEIWIFDAADLNREGQGPLCKLSHPCLDFGYTIHSTWLPQIHRRNATYHISPQQDYQAYLCHKPKALQELFEQEVYPHFNSGHY